jgi:hypothetical protein
MIKRLFSQIKLDRGDKIVLGHDIGVGHVEPQDRVAREIIVALGFDPQVLEEFPVALE